MMALEQGSLEAEMKEVPKELLHHETRAVSDDEQHQHKQRPIGIREGGESSLASAASDHNGASVEQYKSEVSVVVDRHHGSRISGEESFILDHGVETRSAGESLGVPISTEEALTPSTGKKRSKKVRLWKKKHGKQKANKDASEPEVELLSIRVEEPPPASPTIIVTTGPPTSAVTQESHRKPEKEGDHAKGSRLEVQTDSAVDGSTQVNDQSGLQVTGDNDPMNDILDFEDEQNYEIAIETGLSIAPLRPTSEWGLCGEDDRGPPVRTPPRTPPLREPRVKNKGQGQGREHPSSPGGHQLSQSHSPREPWRRKPLDSRAQYEPMRSSSGAQPQGPAVTTIEPEKLEGLAEWNRIKAMQPSAAAEFASHKNWVPRKGIQRGGDGGHNKGRGKARQGRGEQNVQHNHNHHMKELARQKADLRIKQEELLQRSKQTLKAEFQKAKRIEASRKGRDELELELERNLVYCDGELIYLNQ